MTPDDAVVVDRCPGIDNGVIAYLRIWLDDGTSHDLDAFSKHCTPSNDRPGMHYRHEAIAQI
jgi:hypothetical protein